MKKLSNVSCKYGAPMGRRNSIPDDIIPSSKLYLEKMRLNGDYDKGGAYWGYTQNSYIYRATGSTLTEEIEIFTRAANRQEAKENLRKLTNLPLVFFR